ncbi:MAG TPA: UDP-N-acetylglucosamine--N-acetylmuramyl-(pentapeptide) pyrophosphoryl-undecaprenol N-acetylglucosamine transferase [Candidatus Limnocylindrales bacterium]|nr:UDP-N-acetylglucosamine--N-acetylmuramyl-(pentapeptide) pyrophosphoryl-undecaprenol N-acetylglucosamine transferase [Candidatus Limnocylindrales bacterium]
MRILIAAGGTGGHIYPALAVVRNLRERRADAELLWLGGHRGLEAQLVPAAGIELRRLWLRSLRSVDLSPHAVLDPLRLGASVSQAAFILAAWRPDAIFTTGGYASLPVLFAGRALGVPALLWEGNVVPGRSARVTARLADAIAVSFEATCAALGGDDCYVTGTPIRDLGGDRAAARARLELPPDEPCLLLFGGSQAVRRFDAALEEALPALVERCIVLHVTGEPAYAEALRRRERLPQERRARYRPYPFLRDEMADALGAADLVVGRAGSSTLAEVTAAGLPMVVVPYPHAAGHQRANARQLVEAGAAVLVEDDEFDGAALLAAAALLVDVERLAAMASASRSLGRPGAAAANAELLLALAERREAPSAAALERLARGAA